MFIARMLRGKVKGFLDLAVTVLFGTAEFLVLIIALAYLIGWIFPSLTV